MLKIEKKEKNNKNGFSSVIGLILIAIALPLLLFLAVDMPYYMQANRKVKSVTDNVSASAATILDTELLADGILQIEEDKAETYILEDLVVWFNLEDIIYNTNVPGVKVIKRKDDTLSLFNQDPVIIKITPDMTPITDENVKKASKIEYFIHSTSGKATYTFTSGQKVTVFSPTVGVKVTTKTKGLIFKIPVNLVKLGTTEAVFDAQNPG